MKISVFVLATGLFFSAGSASAQEYSIDRASPEAPPASGADIFQVMGAAHAAHHSDLLLGFDEEIDGFTYGRDQAEPLGPNFYVSVFYSVDRAAVGDTFDGRPGGGMVRFQTQFGNGAAGDTFFAKIIWAGPLVAPVTVTAGGVGIAAGMFPISRGLWMDAPVRPLTPTPEPQSDIDGLSIGNLSLDAPVYLTLKAGNALGFSGADILVYRPPATPSDPPTLTLWASAAELGLTVDDEIDGLAIRNPGDDKFNPGDVVWLSLDPPGVDPATGRTVAVWQATP